MAWKGFCNGRVSPEVSLLGVLRSPGGTLILLKNIQSFALNIEFRSRLVSFVVFVAPFPSS